MTTTDYASDDDLDADDDLQDDGGSKVTLDRQRIRSLERDAKQARKAAEENARLQRDLAFIKAGIDTDDPKLAYFVRGYDGEISPDAIRAAAEQAGFLTPSQDTQDAAAQERLSAASAGATSTIPPAANSDEARIAELHEAARTGGKEAVLAKIREHGHNIV